MFLSALHPSNDHTVHPQSTINTADGADMNWNRRYPPTRRRYLRVYRKAPFPTDARDVFSGFWKARRRASQALSSLRQSWQQRQSESIPNPFRIHSESIPNPFRIHSESIPNPFRIHSESQIVPERFGTQPALTAADCDPVLREPLRSSPSIRSLVVRPAGSREFFAEYSGPYAGTYCRRTFHHLQT